MIWKAAGVKPAVSAWYNEREYSMAREKIE